MFPVSHLHTSYLHPRAGRCQWAHASPYYWGIRWCTARMPTPASSWNSSGHVHKYLAKNATLVTLMGMSISASLPWALSNVMCHFEHLELFLKALQSNHPTQHPVLVLCVLFFYFSITAALRQTHPLVSVRSQWVPFSNSLPQKRMQVDSTPASLLRSNIYLAWYLIGAWGFLRAMAPPPNVRLAGVWLFFSLSRDS